MNSGPPIRCAQLIESLGVGGAENLAVRIANAMADLGHDSHILVIGSSGETARHIAPRVKLHELGVNRESVNRPVAFANSVIRGRAGLLAAIRRERVQVVQAHLPGANFWGLLLAMSGKLAVLPTVHNNREFDYGDADNRVRARARRSAYAAMVRFCPAVIAVSDEVKHSLIADCGLAARAGERIRVVRNGVGIPSLPEPAARAATRESFGIPRGHFVFLAAGRHSAQKNLGDLIRAAGLLAHEDLPWTLVVAGDGPDRAALEAAAASTPMAGRIRFPGNVMDLGALMAASDAFVLPSLWEGLPLVLLEAMARGLPVIGNRIPGITDVITEGRDGLLAAPGDAEDLAGAMKALLHDVELCRSCGEQARATVERDYNLRETISSLESLYREFAST